MTIRSLSLVFALSVCGSTWAGLSAPALTPDLLAKGKASYNTNCLSCHGEKGDGNGLVGKMLNPKPRNFVKAKFTKGDKVEQIFETITNGLEKTAMTSYKYLSEENRWALAHYVKSFRTGVKKKG